MSENNNLNKEKLINHLRFLLIHYDSLNDFFLSESNFHCNNKAKEMIRYSNEFNGKTKFIRHLLYMIERGNF